MTGRSNALDLLLGAVLLFPLPAAASDREPWGEAGPWKLYVDRAAGNGCVMERDLENGLRVRIGNLPRKGGQFLDILSREWTDVVDGESGEVDIDFSDDLFSGDATGIVEGAWYGGHIFTNNPEFLDLFARKRSLSVGETGMEMYEISLDGTTKGLQALSKCQESQPTPVTE
ncbi:hypothetical protein CLV78_105229 [Aliiruegeria haliotis]|uniref:Invasion protein IalB n=1 Tax=Aliiruegeria haliotis TaxID=1280846 RepID=A0A2T0RPQ4_9RHOB|nr:hypothetical protein [Aliiruegeria haliotis]PRY23175.1 hypothetical protein CLV78_105229 [Aliiruegeria haliotis]